MNLNLISFLRICIIVVVTSIFNISCKQDKVVFVDAVKKKNYTGIMAKVLSNSGDVFEDAQYLPLPLNHCIITNGVKDTLDVLVMGRPINADSVSFFPYGYFEVKIHKFTRPFLLAVPEDDELLAFDRMSFQDVMLAKYSIKVIIDMWFANYKGVSQTQVTKWNETIYAEKVVKDFLNRKPKSETQKKK
jgi:hypothetical protein